MPMTLSADYQLMDEWLLTTGVSVIPNSNQPVAMFLNSGGQSEALVVHQDGQLYHVCREPLSDSGWNMYGAGARLIIGAGIDGVTAYAVSPDDSGAVWRLRLGKWQRVVAPEPPIEIATGWDGTLWIVGGNSGNVYQYTSGNWQDIWSGGAPVGAIGGSSGNVWLADKAGNIVNLVGGRPTFSQLPSSSALVRCFCVTRTGLITAGADDGNIYEFANEQWNPSFAMPGGAYAVDIQMTPNGAWWAAVSNADGSTALMNQDTNGNWNEVPGPAAGLISASVNPDGSIFALDGNGSAWVLPPVRHAGGTSALVTGTVWQRQITPTGLVGISAEGGVTEVAVAQDGNGVWQAFFSQGGAVVQASLLGTQWNRTNTFRTGGTTLGVISDTGSNGLICYGVSGSGDLMIIRPGSDGGYTANTYPAQSAGFLQGAPVALSAIDESTWFTTTVVDNTLCFAVGPASNPLQDPYDPSANAMLPVTNAQGGDTPAVTALARLPWTPNANPYAVVIDDQGNVTLVTNIATAMAEYGPISVGTYGPLPSPITGPFPSPTPLGAVVDAAGMARLYATDDADRVWVLRQTGGSGDPSQWNWGQWHPLGNCDADAGIGCAYLAASPVKLAGTQDTGDVFTVGTDNLLYLFSQAPASGTWTTASVRRPAGTGEDPDNVRVYKTEIMVLDENGTPSAGTPLTVMPTDEPAALWIEGRQYNLQPGQSATCTTNPLGKLRVFTPAVGLHTPRFQVQSADGSSALSVYPPQHVHDFLAGNAPMNGQTFDTAGNAMVNAVDSNGEPVPTIRIAAQSPSLGLAATAITHIAGYQPTAGWARAQLKVVSSAAPDAPSDFWDEFWNDLCNFAEDVFQAIRSGVLQVVDVVASAVENAITFTVQFLDTAFQKTIQFIVNTAEDIANGLHTAFAWLEATVDDVLDWLKALFDWTAIQNTQTVFIYYVGQIFGWLQGEVALGQNWAQSFFSKLQSEIDGDLDLIGQYFTGQNLNQAANNPSANSQINWGALSAVSASSFFSGTAVNWLIEKVEGALFGSSNQISPVTALADPGQAFYAAASQGWSNLQTAMQDFQSFMQSLGSPSQFQQVGMEDLLKTVKATVDAALEFADAAAQAFLSFVGDALQSADSILTYAMDIPLLSWLFEKFTNQQLTALNVFTLLAAAPVTIVYKLMGGGRYLFTDAQVQKITEPTPDQDLDPSIITAFAYCAAGLNLAWGIFDTCLDALQAAAPIGLQIMDVIFPALVQIFSWPGGVPMIEVSLNTPAENWGFGNWMVSWSPIALNIALMLVGALGTIAAEDARYMDGLGQGLLTALGVLNLGIGAAASALGQKDGSVGAAGVVANTLGPMPDLFQFLRIEAFEELTESISFFIKLFLDFFCGLGTSVAMFLAGSSSLAVTGTA